MDVCETLGPEDDAVVKDLQRLISKVEEMKSQRNMLEDQFRAEVQKDDITHRIVTQEGGNKQVGRSLITEYFYIQWKNPFFRSSGFGMVVFAFVSQEKQNTTQTYVFMTEMHIKFVIPCRLCIC